MIHSLRIILLRVANPCLEAVSPCDNTSSLLCNGHGGHALVVAIENICHRRRQPCPLSLLMLLDSALCCRFVKFRKATFSRVWSEMEFGKTLNPLPLMSAWRAMSWLAETGSRACTILQPPCRPFGQAGVQRCFVWSSRRKCMRVLFIWLVRSLIVHDSIVMETESGLTALLNAFVNCALYRLCASALNCSAYLRTVSMCAERPFALNVGHLVEKMNRGVSLTIT